MRSSFFFSVLQYIKYIARASGVHSIHSPFVYHLRSHLIKSARNFRIEKIESLRKILLRDHTLIDIIDLKQHLSLRKTIRSIGKSSLSSRRFSAFLHLLINELQAKTILETGTSLGINTLYLSHSKANEVITLEASLILAELANRHFQKLNDKKIKIELGDINQTFTPTLIKYQPDFIFLDADHRGKIITTQIEQILNAPYDVKCIVVHDINWSKDMRNAWDTLIEDKRVKLSIDIFQAGIIFPKMGIQKQHFTLRF